MTDLGTTTRWYYRIPYVLLLLFFVLGPFALPLLWKSPRFNRFAKVLLSALIVLLSVWLVWKISVLGNTIVGQFGAINAAR